MNQTTAQIIMIRPKNFGYNEQTAENNAFQSNPDNQKDADIAKLANIEFDQMVFELRSEGVEVKVFEDTEDPVKPDAIFPNNWFSTHPDGSVITYAMYAPNRRLERREDIIQWLENNYKVDHRYSFEQYEEKNEFLEGTGSMIIDHVNKIIYACLSERTNVQLIHKLSVLKGYEKCVFDALDRNGKPIYHTNVMMALGNDLAIICLSSIKDPKERDVVTQKLKDTRKEIVDISFDQMEHFAGNMIELRNSKGEALLIMSDTARKSLKSEQLDTIKKYAKIVSPSIPTIEKFGGGSVRCMIAENFLKVKSEN